MPPLSFSLPFAIKRKINFLFRSEIIDSAFVVEEHFARKRDEPYIPRLTLG